jgi:hypothetical protein
MAAFSHHIKQNTSIVSISHCTELIAAVCLGFIYEQFNNMTNKQPPTRTLLPHTIMAAPLGKKFLAF